MEISSRNGIAATLWMKRDDGKYDGCVVKNGGELATLGPVLLRKYGTKAKASELISKVCVAEVGDALDACVAEEPPAEFYSVCGESVMRMQVKDFGHYCYVFDEDMWWLGDGSRRSLAELIRFIERN
jgi:hypothetical protein